MLNSISETSSTDNSLQIKLIFDQNELNDLKCLNNSNIYLNYFFHFIQSVGILTTTIAAGYDLKYLIWIGVGLNVLASLVNVYEKTNNDILKKLMEDIQKIKDNKYIDEIPVVDTTNNNNTNNNSNNNIVTNV